MKILLINKYLYPRGGAETYLLQLGENLQAWGHSVEYFGMEDERRMVGNRVNAYVRNVDYHSGKLADKVRGALCSIYSAEARRKLRRVLEDFQPDVCHLNNFHYQLTPSILLEIRKWSQAAGKHCRVIYTAHDSQLVCPNHLMRNPVSGENCRQCLNGRFLPCVKGNCIHGSRIRSLLGALNGWYWNRRGTYRYLDGILVPSRFLAEQLSVNSLLREKILVFPNFVEGPQPEEAAEKDEYVLYFGRYSREKGIETLLQAAKALPEIRFVFAGDGPMKEAIRKCSNATDMGFLSGDVLKTVIRRGQFTIVPSECFENCPYSVLESQRLGTPVLGADIGGIPELIRPGETGELFESGNAEALACKIKMLRLNPQKLRMYAANCKKLAAPTPERYCEMLEDYYQGKKGQFWQGN